MAHIIWAIWYEPWWYYMTYKDHITLLGFIRFNFYWRQRIPGKIIRSVLLSIFSILTISRLNRSHNHAKDQLKTDSEQQQARISQLESESDEATEGFCWKNTSFSLSSIQHFHPILPSLLIKYKIIFKAKNFPLALEVIMILSHVCLIHRSPDHSIPDRSKIEVPDDGPETHFGSLMDRSGDHSSHPFKFY